MARWLFWLGLAGIVVATLGPIDLRPETGLSAQVERFLAFVAISFLFTVAYPRRRLAGVLALVATAALLELLQEIVPGRHGRIVDFDAKAVGVLAGMATAAMIDRIGRSVRRT